jgi:hypothetical protein
VQGGRLKELRAGKVGVQVAMSVAEKEVATRKAKVDLPAVLRLGDAAQARDAVAVGKIVDPAAATQPAVS